MFRQFGFQRGGCECEAVPVCGHQTQLVTFGLHEQAVQVKADVLHRHAVLHLRNHVFQGFLRQGEGGGRVFVHVHGGEVLRRQGLQVKAGFACLEREFVVGQIQLRGGRIGQGAQNVLQFFRIGGDAEIGLCALRAQCVDLDFQIGGQKLHLSVFALQQDVRQDGQRVFAFYNAGNGLQGFEQVVATGF